MKTYKFEQFISLFNLPEPIDFDTFCKSTWTLRGSMSADPNQEIRNSLVLDYLEKNSKGKDDRWEKRMELMRTLYRLTVTERVQTLHEWFRQHAEIADSEVNDIFRFSARPATIYPSTPISFDGKKNMRHGRLVKNLNFEKFYGTKKYVKHDYRHLFTQIKLWFEQYTICHSLFVPSSYEHLLKGDLDMVFAILRGTTNRPSAFNPYLYGEILATLFRGKKLFTPVLGWNSYQVAFHNSDYTDYVGIDVIPSVIDNGRMMAEYANDQVESGQVFFAEKQNVELICKPSEKVWSDGDLKHHYGTCDSILFSPPYYNLEIYDSPNQSTDTFKGYNEWLNGYWAPTIDLCHAMLKPGGKIAFVISDYTDLVTNKTYAISEDMKNVMNKRFKEICTHKVRWQTFSTSDAEKMKNGNFESVHYSYKA